jgi:hypothetical protein
MLLKQGDAGKELAKANSGASGAYSSRFLDTDSPKRSGPEGV